MQLEHTFVVPAGVEQAWQVLLDIERIAPCLPGASLDTVDGDQFTGTVKVRLGPIGLTYKGKASFVEKDEQAHRVVIDAQGRDARGNGTASAKVTATLAPDGDEATKVSVLTDLNITGKPAQFGRGVLVDVGNKLLGQFADCLAGKLTGAGAAVPPEAETAPVAAAPPAAQASVEAAPPAAQALDAPAPAVAGPGAAPVAEPAALAGGSGSGSAAVPASDGSAATAEPAALSGGSGSAGVPASDGSAATAEPAARHAAPEAEPIDLLSSAGPALVKRLAPIAAAAVLAAVLFAILRRRR